MKEKDFLGIVPVQYTGNEIETEASVELENEIEAKTFFDKVKARLLNVNKWHDVAGIVSAKFQVVDMNGKEVDRKVMKGDFLKIDIPGPGSKEGEGYDWVIVEELKEVSNGENESTGFIVRPSENPLTRKNETAHFYSDETTSTFIVIRERKKVIAWIVDCNMKPNDEAGSLSDKIRHTTIGIGAIGLFSKIQWKSLAEGLVKKHAG